MIFCIHDKEDLCRYEGYTMVIHSHETLHVHIYQCFIVKKLLYIL